MAQTPAQTAHANAVAPVQKLTDKQQALVEALVTNVATDENGRRRKLTHMELAVIAGYAEGESGRVNVSRTLRLPHVQQAVFIRVAEAIGLSAVDALHTLVDLTTNARSERVRREAASDLLDRGGFVAPERVEHTHDVKISIDLG